MKFGDKVRVVSCPSRREHEGKTGTVCNHPGVGESVIVRVRLDEPGDAKWVEIDGTPEKFESLQSAQ